MSPDRDHSHPNSHAPKPAPAHLLLGAFGEDLAADHLRRDGMRVLERNWRCEVGELDIVAQDRGVIVFCEVKTRRSLRFGTPMQAIDDAKAQRIRRLAAIWQHQRRRTPPTGSRARTRRTGSAGGTRVPPASRVLQSIDRRPAPRSGSATSRTVRRPDERGGEPERNQSSARTAERSLSRTTRNRASMSEYALNRSARNGTALSGPPDSTASGRAGIRTGRSESGTQGRRRGGAGEPRGRRLAAMTGRCRSGPGGQPVRAAAADGAAVVKRTGWRNRFEARVRPIVKRTGWWSRFKARVRPTVSALAEALWRGGTATPRHRRSRRFDVVCVVIAGDGSATIDHRRGVL